MHPSLVQDHMGEFREAILGVLNAAAAHDLGAILVVRLPERRLVDPIGFSLNALGEPECLEHFHRAAGDAVRLAEPEAPRFLLDDSGRDLGERRELRCERQTRGPAADDQDVEDLRQRVGGLIAQHRLVDLGIARPETVEMKLHGVPP